MTTGLPCGGSSRWEPSPGKVNLVDPAQNLLVVGTPNGVTLDSVVTSKTRINSGDQTVTFKTRPRI